MKKEIPTPVFYGAGIAGIVVLALVIFKAMAGPGELPKNPDGFDPNKPISPEVAAKLPPGSIEKFNLKVEGGAPPQGATNAPVEGAQPSGGYVPSTNQKPYLPPGGVPNSSANGATPYPGN